MLWPAGAFLRLKIGPCVFGRRDIFITFENLYKIAGIVETAVKGDFRNRFIRIRQLLAGGLHTVIIQVIQWCAVGQLPEIAAEIIAVHICAGGKVGKPDIFRIVLIYKGKHILQMQHFFLDAESGCFGIKMVLEKLTEQQEGIALQKKRIALRLETQQIQHTEENIVDLRACCRKIIMDKYFLVQEVEDFMFINSGG